MSPIPSVATAFTLSPAVRSVALDPDSAGQSASVMSQHLLGTGGLLFAVVAIFSVAGYFYHGRGGANSARTSNTWASLSSLLSSMRHRGSATTSTAAAATDWPVDLEVGPEVSRVHVMCMLLIRADTSQAARQHGLCEVLPSDVLECKSTEFHIIDVFLIVVRSSWNVILRRLPLRQSMWKTKRMRFRCLSRSCLA